MSSSKARQHLARGVGRMSEMVMTRGRGSWIWTADDRKLLDFTSGIAVTNLGHCHPRVVDAVQKQAATLVHAQVLNREGALLVHHRRKGVMY